MKVLFKVLCIVIILMSLLLLIVNPIFGIIGILLGILLLWKSNKMFEKKQPVVEQEPIEQKPPEKKYTIKVAGTSYYQDKSRRNARTRRLQHESL